MSVELYGNFYPKLAKHIDERLVTVTSVAALPDPTVPANFLYEGALAYVSGTVDAYYKCVLNLAGTALEWQPLTSNPLVIGSINITPGTTVLDLNMVAPAISACYAVEISIVGGVAATIQSIVGLPANDTAITFYVKDGQQVTFKHTDYDVASTDQIVLEVGFDMVVKGRLIGNESLTLKKHGVANCQWDATQFTKSSEWIQGLLSQTVVDNLTTTDAALPLSANQGVILSNMLSGKQQALSQGNNISLTPGLTQTVISVIPFDWIPVVIPASPTQSTNTLSFITSNFPSPPPTNTYRYVDLRSLPWQSGSNRGLWLLPPGKNGANAASWVNIELGIPVKWSSMFKIAPNSNLATSLISNRFYPAVDINSAVGSYTLLFNTDGPSSEKVSVRFPELFSTFVVTYDFILTVNDVTGRQFFVDFFTTNGVQGASTPISGGTLRRVTPGAESVASVSGRHVRLQGSFTMSTSSTANVSDTFNLSIRELTNNFANVTLEPNNSIIQIDKVL